MKLHLVSRLGSVLSPQPMGTPLSMRQRLQVLAASRATRVPPVRQVSQVGGHSCRCHDMKPNHESFVWKCDLNSSDERTPVSMSDNDSQALAASRATRVPPVRQVSQVGGHSSPLREALSSLMLGRCVILKAMDTELSMRRRLQALAASRARREPPVKRVSRVGGNSRVA